MRPAMDADFDATSRYLSVKLDIYFDGIGSTPLTALRSDYLIDADWLEECSADSSKPFGSVSSNELSFRLLNSNGMFSPTNAASPYAGKIKKGVPVILSIKPIVGTEDVSWTALGTYYVTTWDAKVTGTFVDVVANDIWYSILGEPSPNYPVNVDKTHKQLLTEVFALLGYTVAVSDALSTILPYAFVDGDTKAFLQRIIEAGVAYATCTKGGTPVINPITASGVTRAVLTDADQVKTITAKQNITRAYDSVEVTYSLLQLSEMQQILELETTLETGVSTLANIVYKEGPLWRLTDIMVNADDPAPTLQSVAATPWQCNLTLNNTSGSAQSVLVLLYGILVSVTNAVIQTGLGNSLKVSNSYLQSATTAQRYADILNNYITNDMPTLSLSTRGNPLLNVGDKVSVTSARYGVNYAGIIQRLRYVYDGGLSCEMQLVNAEVLL